MAEKTENSELVLLTADIVSAHVSNNSVETNDVAVLISTVYQALSSLGAPAPEDIQQKPKGAVSIRSSMKPDALVSMIDGKPYKMLRRHIAQHGYTPDSYREAFNLPAGYPMVAADYAEKRRALAKSIGLGRKKTAATTPEVKPARKTRKTASPSPAPDTSAAPASAEPKKRGRKRTA